ncbi:MAG: hypothetical protein V3V65_07980, partial [Hyphomicrobium sp.]
MAFRAPRYCHVHAARDVGVAGISLSTGSAHADFPLDNLIDDRAQTLFKFAASVVSPAIDFDLGANFVTGLQRVIIPADHSFTQARFFEADNAGFSGS